MNEPISEERLDVLERIAHVHLTDEVLMKTEELSQLAAEVRLLRAISVMMMPAVRDVLTERASHPDHGYDLDHDRAHGVPHLVDWAGRYATKRSIYSDERRNNLVKAASLLIAAIELIDDSEKSDD